MQSSGVFKKLVDLLTADASHDLYDKPPALQASSTRPDSKGRSIRK